MVCVFRVAGYRVELLIVTVIIELPWPLPWQHLQSDAEIDIDDCDNVATSFPDFQHWLISCGLGITVDDDMTDIPVITIDGPSGSGKGTVSQQLAT